MKNALIVVILTVFMSSACKKKEEPSPEPVKPECVTSPDQFSGKYVSASGDTVRITYVKSNCPDKEKSNTYLVKGIGEVAQPKLKSGETFPIQDYSTISNEPVSVTNYSNVFSLGRQSNGNLLFNSYKINQDNVQLYKQ